MFGIAAKLLLKTEWDNDDENAVKYDTIKVTFCITDVSNHLIIIQTTVIEHNQPNRPKNV